MRATWPRWTRRCALPPRRAWRSPARWPRRRTSAPRSTWRSTTCWPRPRRRADAIALPAAGSPFGSLQVDTAKCTMCLSCVGACPEARWPTTPTSRSCKFIEKNCVQCGLCATTCPESAITLQPRLWLADGGKARKVARVLNEAEPYRCIQCGKPFGTLRAIENMIDQAVGPQRLPGRGAEAAEDVRRLPRHRHHSNPNERRSPTYERRSRPP
jgi:ferredoxin